jgi:hypothetical protein
MEHRSLEGNDPITNFAETQTVETELPAFSIGPHQFNGVQGVLLERTAQTRELREDGLLPAALFRYLFVNPEAGVLRFRTK